MTIPSKKSGFTIIELLVVISIIAMLAGIVITSTSAARMKSRDATRIAELRQVQLATEVYYSIHNQYPPMNSTDVAQNWSDLITALQTGKLIGRADTVPAQGLAGIVDRMLAALSPKTADAAGLNTSIQDPLYPARSYAYMPGDTPIPFQNFRLRAELEDTNNPVLKNALSGQFFYYDEDPISEPDYPEDECAPAAGYYCIGPQAITSGGFQGFFPGKPVIYLYPTTTTTVAVNVGAHIDVSTPSYGSGWNVIAHPDGSLLNPADGQTYPYLFWEGQSGTPIVDATRGFSVPAQKVPSFLASSLAKQGLTPGESAEFIQYWAPRIMTGSPYVYIYFMPQADYDALVPMTIVPKPDTLIRIYMLWKPLDEPMRVIPETLTAPKRAGFTAVEWGGDRTPLK